MCAEELKQDNSDAGFLKSSLKVRNQSVNTIGWLTRLLVTKANDVSVLTMRK